ncbi:MAG: alpha-galactosidase [Hungatella sp.]|nr:alpha-galactosidase [Hungatella sp.]
MSIIFHQVSREFHLYNDSISYIIKILPNDQLGQLYFGKRIHDREDFGYLLEFANRPMTSVLQDYGFSMEHVRQEYPAYGTTDFRLPALEILQENGSRLTNFTYESHRIFAGKPGLKGLPATYAEREEEADTLEITLKDRLLNMTLVLLYTIFAGESAVARSARFENHGEAPVYVTRAMSLSVDLPDCDYDWIQFSGAWSRERQVKTRRLEQGIQAVSSARGHSSHNHNPFIVLKRPGADEFQGEVMGFSLVYSGNFLAQAEVDTYNVTRVMLGINPFAFTWKLESGEDFQTPEAVMAYSQEGLNGMSQVFHRLYRTRLARGVWRDRVRPVLLNNWEATYFDFNEEKLVNIARAAKEDGVELFVLDDGWFGERSSDSSGLGDWYANLDRLPGGIRGLSEKVEALGLKFGLWVELEMVNPDSELYREHPDWALETPGRTPSQGRNQLVLDFSRKEVVDHIYGMIARILSESRVSYIKWDMNRSITECYSKAFPADRQGEIFHRYILGVYSLYERLIENFPEILFESCASGGARFDAGMLFYAPQCWTSDDSDAVERIKIQYGTSFGYPVVSMGAHVSAVPNHQLCRYTPLETRGNVAYFGAFGYELDLQKLQEDERAVVRQQIAFMKEYREVIQFGTFYRLRSPFEHNIAAWMVVSDDKKTAVVGYYKILNDVNCEFRRLRLKGLDPDMRYGVGDSDGWFYGDELMESGLVTTDASAGQPAFGEFCTDFWSRIYVLKAFC